MNRVAILVVEDEVLVRFNAVDFLAARGHAVMEATNADEAIQILEARPDISIVFTDVNMPGSMDGLKLAAAIHKRWPPVLLIVTSGRNTLNDGDLPKGDHFVPKPYTSEQVLRIVEQLAT